ncbi:MAG: DUF4918 family protein [Flavobacteriales bacterium]|nr:DUF4918 family protein [Flavobacteriales bacterium]MCB9166138.1 DUF4918 family protein [Flavobacteriales bacterium]
MLSDRLLDHVLSFSLEGLKLPKDVRVLDPLKGPHAAEVRRIVTRFHRRYYADNSPRLLMLGINPGRLGAGSTGLPFTDTKRCATDLGIPVKGLHTHEPSSDFFYRVVRAAGGPAAFYGQVYVHSLCPLGFTRKGPNGGYVNLNYYDDKALEQTVTPFVEKWLRGLIDRGMRTDVAICIGTGKNAAYLGRLNERSHLFDRIVPVEHPRYIMQYKARSIPAYVEKYMRVLSAAVV